MQDVNFKLKGFIELVIESTKEFIRDFKLLVVSFIVPLIQTILFRGLLAIVLLAFLNLGSLKDIYQNEVKSKGEGFILDSIIQIAFQLINKSLLELGLFLVIIVILLYIFMTFFSFFSLNFILKKNQISLKEIIIDTLKRYPRFLLSSIIWIYFFIFLSFLSSFLLFIPLIFFIFYYYIYFVIFVFAEENLFGVSSLIRSKQIVRGHWLKTFGNIVGFNAIFLIITNLINSSFLIITNLINSSFPLITSVFKKEIFTFIVILIQFFVNYLVGMFLFILVKNLYLTLKSSKSLPPLENNSIKKYNLVAFLGLIIFIIGGFLLISLIREELKSLDNLQKLNLSPFPVKYEENDLNLNSDMKNDPNLNLRIIQENLDNKSDVSEPGINNPNLNLKEY